MLDITLKLLYVLLFCVFQPINGDDEDISCGNFMQDWYPSGQPQTSVTPYALNVSDENGNFTQWSWRSPTYGSKTIQTGSYHTRSMLWMYWMHAESGFRGQLSTICKLFSQSQNEKFKPKQFSRWSQESVVLEEINIKKILPYVLHYCRFPYFRYSSKCLAQVNEWSS